MTDSIVNTPPGGTVVVEAPALALSKLGGPGATDVVIGSTNTPAVLVNVSTQILSGRVIGVPDWNSGVDVGVGIALALDALQTDLDILDMDFSYIYTHEGTAALADLNKTATNLTPQLTVTTAGGLIDETLYVLQFLLDRDDADNPYAGQQLGGFSFQFNINALSAITAVNIVAVGINYAVNR